MTNSTKREIDSVGQARSAQGPSYSDGQACDMNKEGERSISNIGIQTTDQGLQLKFETLLKRKRKKGRL